MTTPELNLSTLFAPRAIAVIGATSRPGSVGQAVFANVLQHNFAGVVYPVNPHAASVMSVKAFRSVLAIPDPMDLAPAAKCLSRLSQLVLDLPEVTELDINPLLVLPEGQGALVLDARVFLSEP